MNIWIVWGYDNEYVNDGEFHSVYDTEEKANHVCQKLTNDLQQQMKERLTPKALACYKVLPAYRVSKHEVK